MIFVGLFWDVKTLVNITPFLLSFVAKNSSQPTTATFNVTSYAEFKLHQVVCEGSQSSRQVKATGLSSLSFSVLRLVGESRCRSGKQPQREGPEDCPTLSTRVFCYIDRIEVNSTHWAPPCSPTLLRVSRWAHLG